MAVEPWNMSTEQSSQYMFQDSRFGPKEELLTPQILTYIASTVFQSSNVSKPLSASHQHFRHQSIDDVFSFRSLNSRSKLFNLALRAASREVPIIIARSLSFQVVGSRTLTGRNFTYSLNGFETPMVRPVAPWVSCSSKNIRIAPLAV